MKLLGWLLMLAVWLFIGYAFRYELQRGWGKRWHLARSLPRLDESERRIAGEL
jgi:hypothetical protein